MSAPLVTIDAPSSRDLDDAIAVERTEAGWLVLVAIADAAGAAPSGSEEDTAARARGETQYFATGNSPMLPRWLAEDRLSLLPQRPRYALTVRVELGADLTRQSVTIAREDVSTAGRLGYEDVPRILADKGHRFHNMIADAAALATVLLDRRRARGALALYDLNEGWLTTEEGLVKVLARREDTIGQVIVQEFMILANQVVAEHAIQVELPVLFRNHVARAAAPPRAELLREIDEARLRPSREIEALRERTHLLLGRATYSPTLHGHYGLNLPAYLHFTSPIRRYADLVNHQQLRALMMGAAPPLSAEMLEAIATGLNAQVLMRREATSAHYKDRAEEVARRHIASRQLDGLNAKQFERALKVELAAGKGPSEAMAEAYPRRAAEGTLPLICQSLLLAQRESAAWAPLQRVTLEHLASHLPDAVSILAQLTQLAGWPAPAFKEHSTGDPHARRFTCRAVVDWGPGDGIFATAEGRTARLARYGAGLGVLAAACNLDRPAIREEAEPPKAGRNPISVLLEWTQKRGTPAPTFTFEMRGTPLEPEAWCTCRLDGLETFGAATTKRDAKLRAAAAMVCVLEKPTPQPEGEAHAI